MKKEVLSNALNNISDEYLQETIDELYSSTISNTRWEKQRMKRKYLYRVAGLAAVLVVAGVGTVAYAKGLFTMNHRQAVVNESYTDEWVDEEYGHQEVVHENLSYVFKFEGPEECQEVLFREGWLPFPPNEDWNADCRNSQGYRTYLSSEFAAEDDLSQSPAYYVQIFYLPQITGDGAMIFEDMNPTDIKETVDGEYRTIQFHVSGEREYAGTEANYIMKVNESRGYCLVIHGSSDFSVLKHIADEMEIHETGKVLHKSDFEGNVIMLDPARG